MNALRPFARTLILSGVLLLFSPSAQAAPALDEAVWLGELGPERYAFEFWQEDALWKGRVRTIREGRTIMEMPCSKLEVDLPLLRLHMPSGVEIEGTWNRDKRLVEASILGPNGSRTPLTLQGVDLASLPMLRAGAPPSDYTYRAPPALEDGWSVASAGEVGIEPADLEALVRAVLDEEAGLLHGLLVARRGRLVLEEYFFGHDRATLHPTMSVTKSVASLLIGLAIDRGEIENVDVPLLGFFPDLADDHGPGWENLRLRHLLSMSMGLDWSDEEAERLHRTGPEAFHDILVRTVTGTPGASWRYVNIDVNLLSGVLRHATGRPVQDLAEEGLFGPLGIERFDWSHGENRGHRLMDGSLHLRPRDMAKIGQMVLDRGLWDGRRVLSAAWIDAALGHQIDTGQGPAMDSYGFLWWRGSLRAGDRTLRVHFANGWGSQFIALIPELELLVVTTGGNQDNGRHFAIAPLLERHLLGPLGRIGN